MENFKTLVWLRETRNNIYEEIKELSDEEKIDYFKKNSEKHQNNIRKQEILLSR